MGRLAGRVRFSRQVSSGSPRVGDVDGAEKFPLWPDSVSSDKTKFGRRVR